MLLSLSLCNNNKMQLQASIYLCFEYQAASSLSNVSKHKQQLESEASETYWPFDPPC